MFRYDPKVNQLPQSNNSAINSATSIKKISKTLDVFGFDERFPTNETCSGEISVMRFTKSFSHQYEKREFLLSLLMKKNSIDLQLGIARGLLPELILLPNMNRKPSVAAGNLLHDWSICIK